MSEKTEILIRICKVITMLLTALTMLTLTIYSAEMEKKLNNITQMLNQIEQNEDK